MPQMKFIFIVCHFSLQNWARLQK